MPYFCDECTEQCAGNDATFTEGGGVICEKCRVKNDPMKSKHRFALHFGERENTMDALMRIDETKYFDTHDLRKLEMWVTALCSKPSLTWYNDPEDPGLCTNEGMSWELLGSLQAIDHYADFVEKVKDAVDARDNESKLFKVWVEVEEDDGDEFQKHDSPFAASASFEDLEKAQEHASFMHACGRTDCWTVVLMYPGSTGSRDLYFAVVEKAELNIDDDADDIDRAIWTATKKATKDNDGQFEPDEFKAILVFQGDHHHEWSANDI